MAVPNATRLTSATSVSALGAWISLHTGAGGGTTGANEAAGGSPAYARKQTTWSNGTTSRVGTVVNISCAAGTYTEGGIWSAVTAGTFVGSDVFSGGSVIVSGTGASIDVTPTVAG